MPVEIVSFDVAGGARVQVMATGKADGDVAVGLPGGLLEARRRTLVDRRWVWLEQVHGGVVVDADEGDVTGSRADAIVTTRGDIALAIHTADCVPVALVGTSGQAFGAVHAGWRGLVAGVVEEAVGALRARGEDQIAAYVGPCISPARYEFGESDLAIVVARFGDDARGRSETGTSALDLRGVVRVALANAGVSSVQVSHRCTAIEEDALFSHRARGERGRQALVVWREDERGPVRDGAPSASA